MVHLNYNDLSFLDQCCLIEIPSLLNIALSACLTAPYTHTHILETVIQRPNTSMHTNKLILPWSPYRSNKTVQFISSRWVWSVYFAPPAHLVRLYKCSADFILQFNFNVYAPSMQTTTLTDPFSDYQTQNWRSLVVYTIAIIISVHHQLPMIFPSNADQAM